MSSGNDKTIELVKNKSISPMKIPAHDEKIIQFLIDSGKIKTGATMQEIEEELLKYLEKSQGEHNIHGKEKLKYIQNLKENIQ